MDEELLKAEMRDMDVVSFFSGWKGKEEHPYTNFRCGVTTVRWNLVLFCFIFFFFVGQGVFCDVWWTSSEFLQARWNCFV